MNASLLLVTDDVADGAGGVGDLAGRGLDHVGNLLERTIERVEHAIELHAHLDTRASSRRCRTAESAGRRDTGSRSG